MFVHGRWFSPGTLASSTTKPGHHDIAEILLKVALNTKNQIIIPINRLTVFWDLIGLRYDPPPDELPRLLKVRSKALSEVGLS